MCITHHPGLYPDTKNSSHTTSDDGCFCLGTTTGFQIFNVHPFRQTFQRSFSHDTGGLFIVEMLYRCNILALVTNNDQNRVLIWDDHQNRIIGELSFESEVRGVRLTREFIIVILQHRIFVYNLIDLKKVDEMKTFDNKKALCSTSIGGDVTMVAFPDESKGSVRVDAFGKRRGLPLKIAAHETEIGAIALNIDSSLLGTASEKGTLVRVFNLKDGSPLHELRRGTDRAVIHCISFDPSNRFLATSSDKGTVHIFSLDGSFTGSSIGGDVDGGYEDGSVHDRESKRGSGILSSLVPKYFKSVWSFAQFRLSEAQSICAFGAEPYTIVVIGGDGNYYKADFSKGGESEKKEFSKLLSEGVDSLE